MKLGYGRTSTTQHQTLEIQTEALKKAGCERLFLEQMSGRTRDRPQLKALLAQLRQGDTVVCLKLDRLARSVGDLCQISRDIEKDGANLQVIDQAIDTSTPTGRLLFHMLAAIAEFEADLIRERVNSGLANAKRKGVKLGRKPVTTNKQNKMIQSLADKGHSWTEIAKEMGISRQTVYRRLHTETTAEHYEKEQLRVAEKKIAELEGQE